MKYSELTALSDEQLVHKEIALERTLTGHLIRHRLGKLENTSVLAKVRRDIARVHTALTAREHAAGLNAGALKGRHASTFVAAPVAAASAEAGGDFLKGLLDGQEAAE